MGLSKINQHLVDWLNQETHHMDAPLCDFERIRYELKPCDVILVEGRSRVSSVIRIITSSPWTHAALYLGRLHDIHDPVLRETVAQYFPCEPDTQLVIESMLGEGTIIAPLSNYQGDHLRICRPKGITYQDSQEVVRYAISRLGTEYDVRQIFDLARFLFPWILLPRKWRSTLFQHHMGRTTRTVCSTMIAEAFGFVQFPILPLVKQRTGDAQPNEVHLYRRNPKLCVPSDFDYSPYFEIIKYPFIDFNLSAEYRLLPWHGSGSLSESEAELYLSSKVSLSTPTDLQRTSEIDSAEATHDASSNRESTPSAAETDILTEKEQQSESGGTESDKPTAKQNILSLFTQDEGGNKSGDATGENEEVETNASERSGPNDPTSPVDENQSVNNKIEAEESHAIKHNGELNSFEAEDESKKEQEALLSDIEKLVSDDNFATQNSEQFDDQKSQGKVTNAFSQFDPSDLSKKISNLFKRKKS